MRYSDFKDAIHQELRRSPQGLTWVQLQERLNLPYDRPCPTWTNRLQKEIGLLRKKGTGRPFLWRLPARGK
jgi:hypothetical protein